MKVTYPSRLHLLLGIFILLLIGNLVQTYYVQKDEQRYWQQQEKRHQELVEATRKSGQVALMGHLMTEIARELQQDPNRKLKTSTLAKIAQLSESFELDSFSYVSPDSSHTPSYNRERGQLLWFLIHSDMDSTSFHQLKQQTNFAQADLAGLSLRGIDLSGAQLQGANLKGAQLNEANLSRADLRGANLWGAELVGANLQEARLNRVDFSWADLSKADLSHSVFQGSKLVSAQLRAAKIREAKGPYSFAKGAFFNQADVTGTDLFGTDLKGAVFREAILKEVDLRETDMTEALLNRADFTEALLRDIRTNEANWLAKLADWKVLGAQNARDSYHIIPDKSGRSAYVVKLASPIY